MLAFRVAGPSCPDAVVRFVAGQVGVEAADLGMYDWAGRTVKFHRAQIRDHLGFRECGLADAEKLARLSGCQPEVRIVR